ncbi:MAG: xylose isomerase [Frondihabitans sp.]|nr:xylose isomerase [Frondihabitans sp.]
MTDSPRLAISRNKVALNAIQWINVKADPNDPTSEDLWLYAEPTFRDDYPGVLAQVRQAGFSAVMMEVLASQTLQDYRRMIDEAQLTPAPGYASIALPEDHGVSLADPAAKIRWLDGIRRKAEESNFFGLSTVFIAPEVAWLPGFTRTLEASAVGAAFDAGRLDRVIDIVGVAAETLKAEGVRAGLHNHVGTWIETEAEIDKVLTDIPADLLGASFDIGHLAWAGIDPTATIARYRDRIVDLHIKDLDLAVAEASRVDPAPYTTTSDRGLFLEPGLGGIDIAGALAELPTDWDGWVIVEVDKASMEPFASAVESWKWVDGHFA